MQVAGQPAIHMGWCAITRARLAQNISDAVLAFDGSLPVLISMSPRTWACYAMDCLNGTAMRLLDIPIVLDNEAMDGTVKLHKTLDVFILVENYAYQS